MGYAGTFEMLEFFKEVWKEKDRKHVSVVSGAKLHFDPHCFAHVLSRGAYPAYKFNKENIVLMTPPEHHCFDHMTHVAKDDPRFDHVFELLQTLKEKYNREEL